MTAPTTKTSPALEMGGRAGGPLSAVRSGPATTATPAPATTAGAGTPHVIGLDPSLTAAGLASSRGWTDVVGMPGKRHMTYDERHNRLHEVLNQITNLIPADTALVVIEGPSYGSNDPSAFDRAALWWRLYDRLHHREIPVAVVPPSIRMLYATGKGRANKGAIIDAVARRWSAWATGGDDNIADAVVLMALGRDQLGAPVAPVPAAHRAALTKVAWPEAVSA